MYLH